MPDQAPALSSSFFTDCNKAMALNLAQFAVPSRFTSPLEIIDYDEKMESEKKFYCSKFH
jgi:hypothetical protein